MADPQARRTGAGTSFICCLLCVNCGWWSLPCSAAKGKRAIANCNPGAGSVAAPQQIQPVRFKAQAPPHICWLSGISQFAPVRRFVVA